MLKLKYIINNCDRGYNLYLPPVSVLEKFNNKKKEWFSAVKYGSLEAAQNAAKLVRDSYLKKNNLEHLLFENGSRNKIIKNAGNNTSGITGVRALSINGHEYWVASIKRNSITTRRSYAIKKHGNENAFLLACDARYKMGGTLYVIDINKLPCKPRAPYEET